MIVCFILVEMTRPLRQRKLLEDSASDGDFAGEGALLVDVVAGDCFLRSLEAESDVSVVPESLLQSLRAQSLLVHVDGRLLQV